MQSISIKARTEMTIEWKDGVLTKFAVDDISRYSQVDQQAYVSDYIKLWKQLAKEDLPRMNM